MAGAIRQEFVDIREIAEEIRARVAQKPLPAALDSSAGPPPGATSVGGAFVPPRTFRAKELAGLVHSGQALAGNLPPTPPTLRGSIGRFLVSLVSRALFWFTPQVQGFQRMTAEALQEQSGATDTLSNAVSRLDTNLETLVSSVHDLQRRNAELRQESTSLAGNVQAAIGQVAELSALANRLDGVDRTSLDILSSRLADVEKTAQDLGERLNQVMILSGRVADSERIGRQLRERVDQIVGLAGKVAANEETGHQLRESLDEVKSLAEQVAENEKTGQHLVECVEQLSGLAGRVSESERSAEALAHRLAQTTSLVARIGQAETAGRSLSQRIEQLEKQLTLDAGPRKESERLLHRLRTDLNIQARRLDGLFVEVRRNGSVPSEASELAVPAGIDNSFYASFEDTFRGTRDDIKNRLTVYVDKIAAQSALAAPVLDIGCGRCEWLELLSENGIKASGVDINRVFVEEGRVRGFDVTLADGLSYLKNLPEASFSAVTAFHLIEHLEFQAKLDLLDQSLRVLKPGGLLILETPNPENILVSTKTFYYDPTHRQPVPADFLKFLVEARGFCQPEVIPMHPSPQSIHIDGSLGPLAGFLNYYFYGCQDYALLARKV